MKSSADQPLIVTDGANVHLHGTQATLLSATMRKQIPGLWCTLVMMLGRDSARSLFER